MATLNDLRTKGGLILTIIIAVAMIAFVLGDLFSAGNIFASRANSVGKIDGTVVEYQDFALKAEHTKNIYSQLWGSSAMSSEQYDMIYDETWSDLILELAHKPSLKSLGLIVSDAEIIDMTNGNYISPIINNFFTDPAVGTFSRELMVNFLSQVEGNPVAQDIWNYIKRNAADNRLVNNYTALVSAGFAANSLEVNKSLNEANTSSQVQVVVKPYYTVADSLIAPLKASAAKEYYKEHKELYRQAEQREVEYVVFNVEPSEADFAETKEAVETLAEEFKAADNAMQFAIANSFERPNSRYLTRTQLPEEHKDMNTRKFVGPELNGTTYTMSRIADVRMMPDSMEARHILLSFDQKELADSIAKALRGGANFAELAEKYSFDTASAVDGGKLGRFAPEQMVSEFSDALIDARLRQIVTVESQFGIHVAQATWKSKAVRKAQVATITYTVEAGDATIQAAANEANAFIAAANNTDFATALKDLGLSKRSARIRNTDRTVSGLNDAREMIRWAYNNKEGKISTAMDIDGDYVVATVKKVRNEGYTPYEEVASRIAQTLRNEAKGDYIASQVADAENIAAVADILGVEIVGVNELLGNANTIVGVGPDQLLVGAISAANEGELVGPVMGDYGVYYFTVDGRTTAENATAESEKVRLDSQALFYLNERLDQALEEGAEIEDNRVRFF